MNCSPKQLETNLNSNICSLYKRMRIPVKSIYRNTTMSNKISNFVLTLPGIIYSKSNPLTGNLILFYDEEITNEQIIKRKIFKFILSCKKNTILKTKTSKNLEFREEIAEPISAEIPIKYENNHKEIIHKNIIVDNDNKTLFHSCSVNHIENMLNTSVSHGLSTDIAQKRGKKLGLNVLSEKKRKSLLGKIVESLSGFSTKLLLGISAVSFLLGQIPDAIAVLGIVMLETTLSTGQQHKAENSIYSLKTMLINKATVIRNGREHRIDSKYVVPGDVILVESGDKVPADARLVDCYDLKTSEASLNGESTPIEKNTDLCENNIELADRTNMLYMGTNVLSGRAKAVVVATGMDTEIGKIASMIQNINTELTPLQIKMKNFTNNLTKICVLSCIVIGGVSLLAGRSLAQVLTMAVGFSIGALPESLPAVVTATMALSAQRLAKENIIVRKMTAIEALGSANVICCDKTGTLTMNQMTVKKIFSDNCKYIVSGSGYCPNGEIEIVDGKNANSESLKHMMISSVLCNNASLKEIDNKWIVEGDPTEGALITMAQKSKLNIDEITNHYTRMKEIPFDSKKRCMTVIVCDDSGNKYAYCKGAFSSVAEKCNTLYENGEKKLFTSTKKQDIQNTCDEMASDALRVLSFAYKKIDGRTKDINNNFTFLGMAGMEDPPREGVLQSIEKCHNAGIKVIMITGDNKTTASAIGRQLGILSSGMVVSGKDLDSMTDEELDNKIERIQVFARTSPKQKYRIVKAFKKFGYIVAMTGDGVNDAPAIKEANIGIAMGRCGSDVAKDVATITLVDDNFCTIVTAIEEGHAVSNNIRNSMKYLLAGSIGEVLSIFLTTTITGTLPFLSIQLLWLNVIAETILGSTLAMEVPSPESINSHAFRKDKGLIDYDLGSAIVKRGLGIGLTTFGVFQGSMLLGLGLVKARTLAFTNLVLAHVINVYDCRSNKKTFPTPYMNIAATASSAFLASMIYVPGLNSLFGTVPLTLADWGIVSGTTLISRT